MNIRVDDTKIREITQAGSTIEAKGDVSVGVQEAAVGQAEEVKSAQAVSVQQTKVDAPFFRLRQCLTLWQLPALQTY